MCSTGSNQIVHWLMIAKIKTSVFVSTVSLAQMDIEIYCISKSILSWLWRHTNIIPAHQRWRQKDQESKVQAQL